MINHTNVVRKKNFDFRYQHPASSQPHKPVPVNQILYFKITQDNAESLKPKKLPDMEVHRILVVYYTNILQALFPFHCGQATQLWPGRMTTIT